MLIPVIDIVSNDESIENQTETIEFLKHISILSTVLLDISKLSAVAMQSNIDLLLEIVESTPCMIDNLSVEDDLIATQLLDAGTRIVFFQNTNRNESFRLILQTFPRSRIGLTIEFLSENDLQSIIQEYRDIIGHYIIKCSSVDKDFIQRIIKEQTTSNYSIQLYFSFPIGSLSSEDSIWISTLKEDGVHAIAHPKVLTNDIDYPILYSPSLTLETVLDTILFDFLDAFIGCLKTDRLDGMYSTVVCDEVGICLGLVYSTKESIRAAFIEKKGIYWSRSRRSLWRKGDTSGMYQELLEMKYDCDGDALRYIVIQHGNPSSFCHLMTRSCWGNEKGFQKLENMLKDRKLYAPEGSYTKRLFNDSDLLRKKLLEEVQELVEANEHEHIASEAADVMYFMMTRCVAAGVSIKDIERNLDKKSFKVSNNFYI